MTPVHKFVAVCRTLDWVAPLLLRLVWGTGIMLSGKGKIFDLGLENVANWFGSLKVFGKFDLPLPTLNAYMAGGTELVCGALVLVGLGTRLASIPLIFTMLVALATAHWGALTNISEDSSFMGEFASQGPVPYLFAFIVLLFVGPGKVSVDHAIGIEGKQD